MAKVTFSRQLVPGHVVYPKNGSLQNKWNSRVSITVPLACEASALPFELLPHFQKNVKQTDGRENSHIWTKGNGRKRHKSAMLCISF